MPRIGLHHLGETTPETLAAYIAARPSVVKALGPDCGDLETWWKPLKAALPGVPFIVRHFIANQGRILGRRFDGGIELAGLVNGSLQKYPNIFTHAEGLNEPCGEGDFGTLDNLDMVQAGFHGELRRLAPGVTPIAFNFGNGVGQGSTMGHFPETLKRYKAFGFHAYWSDDPDNAAWRDWLAYRHQRQGTWAALPPDAQIFMTECGLTLCSPPRLGDDVGWRKAGITPAQYAAQLKRANAVWSQEPRFKGATVFICGGKGSEWTEPRGFDIFPEVVQLLQEQEEAPVMTDWLTPLTSAGVKDVRSQLRTSGTYAKRALPGTVQYLVAHYVGAPIVPGQVGLAFCQATARYHVDSRGWPGIGYHFCIDVLGDIYLVGDLDTSRANVANKNHLVVGACIQGGGDNWVPNEAQRAAWYRLWSLVNAAAGKTLERKGHRDLQATLCPGNRYKEWLIPPVAQPPAPAYVVGEGIKNHLKAYPTLGEPVANAVWDSQGNEYVMTSRAAVVWSKQRNSIRSVTW